VSPLLYLAGASIHGALIKCRLVGLDYLLILLLGMNGYGTLLKFCVDINRYGDLEMKQKIRI